jgi:hypothetical protein
MAKKRFVKLGEKASVFFDPINRLKVLPNDIVEVSGMAKFSSKINAAIKGGHLEVVSEDEYNEWQKANGVKDADNKGNTPKETVKDNFIQPEGDEWMEDYEDYTEESLKKLTNANLVKLAVYHETEMDEKDLAKLSKANLIAEILELTEEDEDDEE